MLALSDADAVVLAAVVPVVIGTAYNAWQARLAAKTAKQTSSEYRKNGGSSLRDAIDRVEDSVTRLHHRHDELASRITLIEDHVTTPKGRR